jgi:hypothetical protein
MSAESIAEAIQNTDFFTAVRESALVYPIVLSTHLTMIAIFGGLILVTNLRMFGWVLTGIPLADIIHGTRPWKWVGFLIMISCGILLGGAKLATYYANPYFLIKMTLLAFIGAHALIFRRTVYRNPELDKMPSMPREAKIAATISIILWVGVLSMGRWIAYYEPPKERPAATAAALSKTMWGRL